MLAHSSLGRRAEGKIEVGIEAVDGGEGVLDQLAIVHVGESLIAEATIGTAVEEALEPIRPVLGDLDADFGQIDVIREGRPQDRGQARDGGEDGDRITVRLDDDGIGIRLAERIDPMGV